MSSTNEDSWTHDQPTNTYTDSRYSYNSHSDGQRYSSDGDDSEQNFRRVAVSPTNSQDDTEHYSDDDSIDEVARTLSQLDDEDDGYTDPGRTDWSSSYTGPSYTSASRTYTDSQSRGYTGSPSFVSLPSVTARSPPIASFDARNRLSRITERTENSRPVSAALSATRQQQQQQPDSLRRSAILGSGASGHSRAATDPSSDRSLPPAGRLSELRAVFESPSAPSHSRVASTPPYGTSSPSFPTMSQTQTTAPYTYGTTSYGSRSSPTKSSTGSAASYTVQESSLLTPPTRPVTTSGSRSVTGTSAQGYSATGSYTSPSYTATSITATQTPTWTNTNTRTRTETYTPDTQTWTYTDSDTYTRTSVTPRSGLQKPEATPRSPPRSVRNIVALWKERTPATPSAGRSPPSNSVSPPPDDGIHSIRRQVEGARARLRRSRGASGSHTSSPPANDAADTMSIRSGRSGILPPGFDMNELSSYAQSSEPPLHIGLLWYLNVHTSPPYRWQRCQALLYPHMLLLSWLAPGGGRGIVALDLLNCTSVQSAPAPTHPSSRDDVGTIAARNQVSDRDGAPLTETLVPFHMLYTDGVERLAAESLLERQKWINRVWETVNRPVNIPDSVSVTRSPTLSIRTIQSMKSSRSSGSQSTVFVPPLSSLPDISDWGSSTSLSRQSSIISSHHSRTVDDIVIQNQEYIYPGDPRAITPTRGRSLRRSNSLTDIDEGFKSAIHRARGSGAFMGSPVTVTSGSSLGKEVTITQPPTTITRDSRDSRRYSSDLSDSHFYSAGSSDSGRSRSNISSTYYSPSSFRSPATPLRSELTFTPGSTTQGASTFLSPSRSPDSRSFLSVTRSPESRTYRSGDSDYSFVDTPSSLSRAREIRRRGAASSARSYTSGYQTEISRSSSDKENEGSEGTRSRTASGDFTPYSASASLRSDSISGSSGWESRSRTPTGSYTGSYTPSERSSYISPYSPSSASRTHSDTYTHSTASYTHDSHPSGSPAGSSAASRILSPHRSPIANHTPISSSETGYDVCPSSDFTDISRPTFSTWTHTPISATVSPTVFPLVPEEEEKYVTVSEISEDYAIPAQIQSSRASITSFESFPVIPGTDYVTADSASTSFRTASEPEVVTDFDTASEAPESTTYGTADLYRSEVPVIPSEHSTPTLSSLKLSSRSDAASVVDLPEVIPTIPSPSTISEMLPEEVPLPPSVFARSAFSPSTISTVSDLGAEEVPLPPSVPGSIIPPIQQLPELSPLALRELPPLPRSPVAARFSTQTISDRTPTQPSRSSVVPSPASYPSLQPSAGDRTPTQPSRSPMAPSPAYYPSSHSPTPTPTPRQMSPLPPLPPSEVSLSPSLSPSPTPLEASLEQPDVPTPSSLRLGSSTPSLLSSHRERELTPLAQRDEDSISLSLLSSLPESSLGTMSVVTPTSLALESASTASTAPPASTPVATAMSPSISTASPISASSSFVSSSAPRSSLALPVAPPQRRRRYIAAPTDVSYESSVLQPSPSVQSIALAEEPDASFETSFLRPSMAPSSIYRASTVPPSPSAPSIVVPEASLPPLTPLTGLPASLLSGPDADTPSSLYLSSEPSSLNRSSTISSTTSVVTTMSQSSLGSSVFEPGSLIDFDMQREVEPEEEEIIEPESEDISSIPLSSPTTVSTLSLAPSEPHRSLTPTPLLSSHAPTTPEGSIAMSISTPRGSGQTEQSSLRTVPSISAATTRDLGLDIDRLADHIHAYDAARAVENDALAQNVGALRDELRDLADFLRRPSPPREPIVVTQPAPVIVAAPAPVATPPRVQLVDRPVGSSSIMTADSDIPRVVELDLPPAIGLSRNASTASSMSYLPSHHSDDGLFDDMDNMTEVPESATDEWQLEMSESGVQVSVPPTTISSPPSSPSSESAGSILPSGDEIGPPVLPPELSEALDNIRAQLRALEGGQEAAQSLLQELSNRPPPAPITIPEPQTGELKDRLQRIEDLIQGLIQAERDRPVRDSVIVQNIPPSDRTSIAGSTDSSSNHLNSLLRDLMLNPDMSTIVAPTPGRPRPSVAQQLDEILSAPDNVAPADLPRPPPVEGINYHPGDRPRPRSASPASINVQQRSQSVPVFIYRPPMLHPRVPATPTETTGTTDSEPLPRDHDRPTQPPPGQPQPTSPPRTQTQTDRTHPTIPFRPPVRPVRPEWGTENIATGRPPSAPSTLGADSGKMGPSWYKSGPPKATAPSGVKTSRISQPDPTVVAPPAATQPQANRPQFIPMPAGPTVVQLPPLFDSLMEILRENRLAQLATVDQQRELMRYMRGLNEWLGRDVQDRQAEIQQVVARVDQLGAALHRLQTRAPRSPTPSTEDSSGSPYPTGMPPTRMGPTMPPHITGYPPLPPTFVPYSHQPGGPVIPPPVPGDMRTPGPQPQVGGQMPVTVVVPPHHPHPPPVPFIPTISRPGTAIPDHGHPPQPFIPSPTSTGTPRPVRLGHPPSTGIALPEVTVGTPIQVHPVQPLQAVYRSPRVVTRGLLHPVTFIVIAQVADETRDPRHLVAVEVEPRRDLLVGILRTMDATAILHPSWS